jgi:NADPH:quinone reductase-like Zn-dependent oxidoreductase
MKIPDDMSFEDASALGVGIVTVGQGMYQSMRLPWPEVGKETAGKNGSILIYGGSTATGAYAIQFAKL